MDYKMSSILTNLPELGGGLLIRAMPESKHLLSTDIFPYPACASSQLCKFIFYMKNISNIRDNSQL